MGRGAGPSGGVVLVVERKRKTGRIAQSINATFFVPLIAGQAVEMHEIFGSIVVT